MNLYHGKFKPEELIKVPLKKNPVILKSGGPIMEVLMKRKDEVLCEWDDGRAWFSIACLYQLKPMEK